jgi:LCP family protein required for cell wall assembly
VSLELPENRPPRVSRGLYQRYAIAGALIVLMTAASVATAGLLKIQDEIVIPLRQHGHTAKLQKDTITRADAGQPQTILLVGSDRRFGAKKGDARSDTMMLLRLDPDQQATAVMSVPRDLLVDIPGHGREKINAAYSYGGLDLTTRTIKQLLGIQINHAIEVNFSGFRHAVDFVGCVYTDVDRRYYHSNLGLPPSAQYAEIDLQPGYQRLCGQKALDYVRFRHADNDLVRAARQQDFLRQAKDQVGTSRLINDHKPLITIFAKATETDADLQSETGILKILKLAIFSAGHPTREIEFPHSFVNSAPAFGARGVVTGLGSYVTATPEQIAKAADDFMHARASAKPKSTGATKKLSKAAKKQKKNNAKRAATSWSEYSLVDARRRGEDLVAPVVAKGKLGFPLYFPSALTATGTYPAATTTPDAPMPRIYNIRDRAGKLHQAYRIVVVHNQLEGQYYGIQGTTWKTPPLLKRSSETRQMRGRTYKLYYDGKRLRAVAWTTPRAVYWVSNTLSLQLTNKQMLGTARSLTRFGVK